MTDIKTISPVNQELPSKFAEKLSIGYSNHSDKHNKKEKGQFFTPSAISEFMGKLSNNSNDKISILDPGSGIGILSCSVIEHLVEVGKVKFIELSLYENDDNIIPFLKASLNYLSTWLENKDINFTYEIINRDFVLENYQVLEDNEELFKYDCKKYDIVISNPPFFKLPKDDERSIATKSIVNGHPNIYAMFMAIASKLLKNNGEFIFIIPRSFTSGNYFKLFREKFFKIIEIEKVHLFNSRTRAFKKDSILQETIIIKGVSKTNINRNSKVLISSSESYEDLNNLEHETLKNKELINLKTENKILYLPARKIETKILSIFQNWENTFENYNIRISTGPVVSFRTRDNIYESSETENKDTVPLFWLHNVSPMELNWPLNKNGKGQYIENSQHTKSLLVLNKNYIFLRRFSTKEDNQRLVAAPYFSNGYKINYIGIENKLNYIYRKNVHLSRTEIIGFCALLNSKLYDTYFRIFNGNINVSATELRALPLPELNLIENIGNKIIMSNNFSLPNSNYIVDEILKIKGIFNE